MTVKENISLKSYNTFGIQASAKTLVEIGNIEDLKDFCQSGYYNVIPRLFLGGGSNILFTEDFNGVILHSKINDITIVGEDKKNVLIKAGSGITWDKLVEHCVLKNWGGIENLSHIPGNVGAAPVQNIGAYGVEAKDTIFEVEAFDMKMTVEKKFNNEDCKFGYRSSIFKKPDFKDCFITYVTFRLSKSPVLKDNYGSIKDEMEKLEKRNISSLRQAIINIRQSKLPSVEEIGNAGSFFKNPVLDKDITDKILSGYPDMPHYCLSENKFKIPAAWLIEQSGLKGYRKGNVGTFHRQPLVIVSYGETKGTEIKDFSNYITKRVENKFGIKLEPEVCFI